MAWSEVLTDDSFSVGVAPQSDINTVGTAWVWIDCEMPQVSYDAAQTDMKRSRRSRGSGTKRRTGRVWPKLAIRFPVCGQIAAYAFASDTPGFKAANLLLDFLGGSSAIAYAAANVTTSDANTFSLASIGKLGALIAAREASGAVNAMGYAKTIGSGGPYVTNLFEDVKVASAAGVARIATFNAFPSVTAPSALTIRVTGESTAMERRYLGCVLTRASFAYDADWRLYCTAELIAYGGEVRGTAGGFTPSGSITETLALEPLVARGGARTVLASNVFGTLNDATVDANGTCDVRDLELAWDIPHYVARVPTGIEGVYQVVTRSPTITASFSVPDISDFESSAQVHFGEDAWRNLGEVSLAHYSGDTAGQICAWAIRRGIMTGYPEPVFVEGVRHRKMTIEAYDYTGDEASTEAGNKTHVFSLG